MTPNEISLVQLQWSRLGGNPEQVALLFYDRLFELAPEIRCLFPEDLFQQGRKLMDMLQLVVENLHRLPTLQPQLRELGQRHEEYGAQTHHYEAVGAALLWTLEQVVGEEFTSAAADAWAGLYAEITCAMTQSQAAAAS